MGFAMIENIIYLFEIAKYDGLGINFWLTYTVRSLVTTFAHGIFTGIFGFAYASAYLLKKQNKTSRTSIINFHQKIGQTIKTVLNIITLKIIFSQILNNKKTAKQINTTSLIIAGILSAIYVHFLFNFLVKFEINNQSFSFILPGIMMILGWSMSKKFTYQRYKAIIHPRNSPLFKNWGIKINFLQRKNKLNQTKHKI